jgi:microcystin-dependent protein
MALTIPPITSLPTPPTKADPNNFSVRADDFLAALPDFQAETNEAITEMNKITSGLDQASPIAAWAIGTTYDFPDVVAGSDGYSYRCIDTGVVGEDPTTDDGTYWVKLSEPPLGVPTSDGMVLSSTTAGERSWVSAFPVGSVFMWMTSTAPAGTLELYGQAVSRLTYSALFSVWGVMYGPGDGVTTFNLPDMRGEFVRGWDHGRAVDPDRATRTDRGDTTDGDAVGTKQLSAIEEHSHVILNTSGTGNTGDRAARGTGPGYAQLTLQTYGNPYTFADETRPRNINVMFVVKY